MRVKVIMVATAIALGGLIVYAWPPKAIPRSALSLPEEETGSETSSAAPFRRRQERRAPSERSPMTAETVHSTIGAASLQPVWHHRPESEWQGMKVDLNLTPPCDSSEHCGLGRACKAGVCTACASDADCAGDEVCVLDHCLEKNLAGCRGVWRPVGLDRRACSAATRTSHEATKECVPSVSN